MGLKEQLSAGSNLLVRDNIRLTITGSRPQYTGSVDLGGTFTLISALSTTPCRIRLYGNSGSRNDVTELGRPFNSQSTIASNIALIADINLTDTNTFNFYPPVFGTALDISNTTSVYYTIDTGSANPFSGTTSIIFNRFLLEDTTITNLYSVNTRETLYVSASALVPSAYNTGSFQSPRTYLLYNVQSNFSTARLRLYTTSQSRDNTTELSRVFATEPNSGSGLIADLLLDATQTFPVTPLLIGRNDTDQGYFGSVPATQETYYTLTNLSAGTVNASVTMSIFSLED